MKLFDDSYIEQIVVSQEQRQTLADIVAPYFLKSRVLLIRQVDNLDPMVIDELTIEASSEGALFAPVDRSVICKSCETTLDEILHSNRLEAISLNEKQVASLSACESFSEGLVYPVTLDEFAHVWCVILSGEGCASKAVGAEFRLQIELFSTRLALKKRTEVLQEARKWIDYELGDMSRVQHLLLPDSELKIPGVELAFRFKVYRSAGGDYIDISDLDKDAPEGQPRSFGAILADVTGHGPSATIEAVMLDAILRTFKPDDSFAGPSSVLNYINQHFFTRRERGRFVTAVIMNYLPERRTVRYACAGHPHAYIKRGKEVIRLGEGGIPVGIVPDYLWETHEVEVQKDDVLFMYTDVAVETRNIEGEEFGFERLEEVITASDVCPHCVVDDVEQALQRFAGRKSFDDDLTLCGIQITH